MLRGPPARKESSTGQRNASAMEKGRSETTILAEAEFLLLSGDGVAAAVAHSPGSPPRLLGHAQGGELPALLWEARELGVPALEVAGLDGQALKSVAAGSDIPERLYPLLADCLAALHQDPQAPRVVRLCAGPGTARRRGGTGAVPEVASLRVRLGEAVPTRPLEEALEASRHRLEVELGLIISRIPVEIEPALRPRAWTLSVREVEAASGELGAEMGLRPLLDALSREVHARAWQLLGYRETEALLASLRRTHGSLVEELFPRRLAVATLRTVLRNLLREGIPVRDLPAILEALLEGLPRARDPERLTEFARSSFSYYLCQKHSDEDGVLWALMLHPEVEAAVLRRTRRGTSGPWLDMDLEDRLRLMSSVMAAQERALARGVPAVVLASPEVRPFLRRMLEGSFPDLPVLSYSEIVPLTDVRTLALLAL